MHSLDDVFELFSQERRRLALYYLEERDGPVPVDDLVSTVEEWEEDEAEIPDGKYEDVEFALTHKDLPKAAQAEFVEYDPEDGVIELSGEPPEFSVILSVAEAIEQPEDDGVSALL